MSIKKINIKIIKKQNQKINFLNNQKIHKFNFAPPTKSSNFIYNKFYKHEYNCKSVLYMIHENNL